MQKIPLSYFQHHDVVALSRSLIGKYLFTRLGEEKQLTGGMITETEAYRGAEDKACHAYGNRRTKRTETMYAPGGTAYVYLCYGMHHLFNIVTNQADIPHAILIRAIRPEMGIDLMLQRRSKSTTHPTLTSGPGTVCQALGIHLSHDGVVLNGNDIWLEDRGMAIPDTHIQATPRIGVGYAEEDALLPWRFLYRPS